MNRVSLFNNNSAHGGFVRSDKSLSLLGWRNQKCDKSENQMSNQSCASMLNKVSLPENISFMEKSIHKLLDDLEIDQVNVKEYVESFERMESPNVNKLLD